MIPKEAGKSGCSGLRSLWLICLVSMIVSDQSKFSACAGEFPDITSVAADLGPPPPMLVGEAPSAGKRVRMSLPAYAGTDVHHALYLPTDWQPEQRYPVIVEYAGNGPYSNAFGDISTGKVEDCLLGYGISGGAGFIWLTLPYVSEDGQSNQRQWWGSVENTIDYCKRAVPKICAEFGGNGDAVFIAGFSRGAIACNFIGLHDDEIAKLWRGFICHSHYDGVKKWSYEKSDRASAAIRLARLAGRPQFISQERSIDATRDYLTGAAPDGDFTFVALPYRNHSPDWLYRDIPERRKLRAWLAQHR